jgi:hypothetical protein
MGKWRQERVMLYLLQDAVAQCYLNMGSWRFAGGGGDDTIVVVW